MEKILDVIYSNFDNTELNIQYIAKNILFMNEDYFGRVFIRNMHLKFSAYLEQSRIEMAKRLLEYNPDMRIAMLTELIGYPADGQYFSKTFQKGLWHGINRIIGKPENRHIEKFNIR